MEKLTHEFELGKIANDFRFHFTNKLSQKAEENSWKSSFEMQTNSAQDALYFSQTIALDTDRVAEGVYSDIQDVLEALKCDGFAFDVKTIKKGYSFEVTNIRCEN